jgi:hypothetical protein
LGDPVRSNLAFFIGLRNKIEHRYARQQPALFVALAGHAQALLLNYEEELTTQFGVVESLATRLRFPVFVGSFTDEGERTLQRLRGSLPPALRTFVAEYRSGLSAETEADSRFELRLRVVNELAPKDPDALPLQFTRFHELTEEQKAVVEEMGRKGLVITRERMRNVRGDKLRKPTQAAAEIAASIPFKFTMGHFTKAWKLLRVRPESGAAHPEITDERYCVHDLLHHDYGYTQAYIDKLIRECSTEQGFRSLLEYAPQDKITGEWVGDPPPGSVPPWRRRAG